MKNSQRFHLFCICLSHISCCCSDPQVGLHTFKAVFTNLMVETSADFSLRSVPQLNMVGPAFGSSDISGEVSQAKTSVAAESDLSFLPPKPPGLKRGTSSELRRAAEEAETIAPPVWARQTSEEIARRFANMTSWEESDHPIALFNMNSSNEVDSCNVVSLNDSCVAKYVSASLRQSLDAQKCDIFSKDWKKVKNEEAASVLRRVDGLVNKDGSDANIGGVQALEPGYILTVDNMLKMLSIQLRLRFNLPVIIMGETG